MGHGPTGPVKLYLHGKEIEGHVEVHEHVSPFSTYVKVLVGLFILTGLTYAVSYADLGPASLTVAMVVAVGKATLVCMYFMHLKYDDRYHVFVFLSSLLFVGIFFTITMFDLQSRDRMNEEQDTFFRIGEERNWDDHQKALNFGKHLPPAAGEGKSAADAKAPEGKADAKADGKAPAKAADGKGK